MSRVAFLRPPASGMRALLAVLVLAACAAGPMGGSSSDAVGPSGGGPSGVGPSGMAAGGRADLATQQACRQRVNEMYDIRNRGEIYLPAPTTNTPFSADSQVGVPSSGLAGQFAYGRALAECERNAESGGAPVPTPSVSPAAAKGR